MATALITGASSGIGRVLVEHFARDKHDVVLVARRDMSALCSDVERTHGVTAHALSIDLSKPGAAERMYDATVGAGMTVDFLVNNAGFSKYGPFADSNRSEQSDIIATNVTAVMEATHLFLKPMLERKRGRILQVSSTAAFQPGPRMATYYAAKAFVLSFSEALSNELDGTGVTVTTLCPGPTRTEFTTVANYKETGLAGMVMMSAEDVARAGYAGLMRGERVVIPGAQNKVSALSAQLMPRALVLRMTAALTKSRE